MAGENALVPVVNGGLRIADESQAWALLDGIKASFGRTAAPLDRKARGDLLASAHDLCRRQRFSLACQNAYAEQRIRELRELGIALDVICPQGKIKRSWPTTFSDEQERTTITALGITKDQSARCRQLAAIGEEDLAAYCAAANQREDDISIPDLLRRAYVSRRAPDEESRQAALTGPAEEGGKDRFQTPPWALGPLWEFLPPDDLLIEPCCGERYLADEFRRRRRRGVAFDILTGVDFLAWRPGRRGRRRRRIVTNPPGSKKTDFVAHAAELLEEGLIDAWAYLMPEDAFGGKERQAVYLRRGLQVILMGGRIQFKTPTGREDDESNPHEEYAWFTCGFNLPSQLCLWNREEQRLVPIPCGPALGCAA